MSDVSSRHDGHGHVITSVWSSYGHTFMSDGEGDGAGGGYESCLTCGAMYVLRATSADDPTHGEYQTNGGGTPDECSRDTSMVHGYRGERHCHEHQDDDEPCEHVTHGCNCVACDS